MYVLYVQSKLSEDLKNGIKGGYRMSGFQTLVRLPKLRL